MGSIIWGDPSRKPDKHGNLMQTDTLRWARWTHETGHDREVYMVQVSQVSKREWSWLFGWTTGEDPKFSDGTALAVGSGDADENLIHTPAGEDGNEHPVKVLETLASFVTAWDEAVKWGLMAGRASENTDLFPTRCEFILSVAEEFYSDATFEWEKEQANGTADEGR